MRDSPLGKRDMAMLGSGNARSAAREFMATVMQTDLSKELDQGERSSTSHDVEAAARQRRLPGRVCESNGVELRNSPAYIREWVTRETADRNTSEKRTKGTEGSEDA